MLPGVELARRRRVHGHGDVAAAHRIGRAPAGEPHHRNPAPPAQPLTGVVGPVLAARIRLEERLRRGASSSPPSLPSRWSRLMREQDGRETTRRPQEQEQQQQMVAASIEKRPNAAVLEVAASRAELKRTLSKVDLCAVCLEEVQERRQRITWLPCSHKYHSDCVLPWLAVHPDCPCCRTLVPSVNALT